MDEQSKAAKRRFNDGAFQTRYFVGYGLDVGAGRDGLGRYGRFFSLITGVENWDIEDGDAQYLPGVNDGHYGFLHSSHCLEHLTDPAVALQNWVNVVVPGGHLVIAVPDEDMYEQGFWPSHFNHDHEWTFTIFKSESWSPRSINLLDLLREVQGVSVERIAVVRDFFVPSAIGDQTLSPNVESSIEFVLRRLY